MTIIARRTQADPGCDAYCAVNPEDPSCQPKNTSGGDNGGGNTGSGSGGGSGSSGGCQDDAEILKVLTKNAPHPMEDSFCGDVED